jgi:hypothetical protein
MHSLNPGSGNKSDILFSLDVEKEYKIPRATQRVWACHDRYGWKGLVLKIGTRTAYRRSEIEAWLESRRLGSNTGESTGELTGEATSEDINAQTAEPEEAIALSETPSPPVALSTDTPIVTPLPEHPARLPPKRVAALTRKAKKLSAQGVSWKAMEG